MENKITIPKPCNENWNSMSPDKNGRFCNSCNKTVIDFTKMNHPEIQKFFTENSGEKRICGHFKLNQIESEESIKYDKLRGRFSRIKIKPIKAIALFSLSLFFTLTSTNELENVVKALETLCAEFRSVSIAVNKENTLRYHYALSLKKTFTKEDLMNAIRGIEGVKQVRLSSNEVTPDL